MYIRHETGKIGEDLACEYILKKNFEIIERNFRCKIGEIDIIAKDKDELVFIEVKTRSQNKYGNPSDAVDKYKKKHIYHAAEYYMMINRIENVFCRLDVMEVFMYDSGTKINYLKNCILEKPHRKFYIEEENAL